jgi:RNA polymerase sigma factor (sigma-70 family)
MAISHQQLRNLALEHDRAEWTDGQLLEDFISRKERAALEALVLRHGPMVWGVCCRLLNQHAAEDAFQATFIILIRKAASILPREMVGNWLYGVARQTALNVKTQITRQSAREVQGLEMPEPATTERQHWPDLQPLLDQELSRLPDKYRVAIVLCDLEGKTRKEVARQLNLPEGTVASRLARGKAILANRLARHGLAVSAGALEVVLSQKASGTVPNSVMTTTIKALTLDAAGQAAGAISVEVANLIERVLKTMHLSKLKSALVAILVAAVAAAGAIGVGLSALGDDKQQTTKKDQPQSKEEKPAQQPQKANAADLRSLQGEWQGVEAETKGKKAPDEEVKDMRFVFKDDTLTIHSAAKPDRERKKTFKLDATKSPKEIDITSLDGAEKDKVAACIYKFEKDRLTLCMPYWNKTPSKRPKAFEATVDDGQMVFVLERLPSPAEKERPANEGRGGSKGEVRTLLKAKLEAAKEAYQEALENLRGGRSIGPEEVYTWSVRFLNAQREMSDKLNDHMAALEEHVERMKMLKKTADAWSQARLQKPVSTSAQWYLAEAELWLAKEKAK